MTLEHIHHLSLGLTPIVLVICILVLAHYGTAAWRYRRPLQPSELLVLGIAIGFVGKLLDNCYWGLAWTAYHDGRQASIDWYFAHGPAANVLFRQLALIVSGICHCLAAARSGSPLTRRAITGSILTGLALTILLWLIH